MIDYYDRILLAIAAVMIAGAAVGLHLLIEINQGLAGGSLVATLFLYEILFILPAIIP